MKKHRNKIISVIAIAVLLATAFLYGGNTPKKKDVRYETVARTASIQSTKSDGINAKDLKEITDDCSIKQEIPSDAQENKVIKHDGAPEAPLDGINTEEKSTQKSYSMQKNQTKSEFSSPPIEEQGEASNKVYPEIFPANEIPIYYGEVQTTYDKDVQVTMDTTPDVSSSAEKTQTNTPTNYETTSTNNSESAPHTDAKKQKADKAESSPDTPKELKCTLSVRCDTIFQNTKMIDSEKLKIIPEDGIIFAEKTVSFYEGESVFNLLLREMKQNKIHMEFENTPIYNSAYIEGIANLYEFDCGELSGWMYKVNDWFPNYGCSRYMLEAGDKVEWVYTCDLGNDVGGQYSARNGN